MNSVKARGKIEEAAKRLNLLSTKRIETWIGNFRRKEKGASSKPRKRTNKQGPNAYSEYVSTQKRGTTDKSEYFKKCSENYKALSEEELQRFKAQAAKKRKNVLGDLSREELFQHYMLELSHICERMCEAGFEAGGLVVDHHQEINAAVYGSKKAVGYFESSIQEFTAQMIDSLEVPKNRIEKNTLKKVVRKCFNNAFSIKDPKKREQVPYLDILNGNLTVIVGGMPEGIDFKDPSNYSKGQLVKIADVVDQIDISIVNTELASTVRAKKTEKRITSTTQKEQSDIQEPNIQLESLADSELSAAEVEVEETAALLTNPNSLAELDISSEMVLPLSDLVGINLNEPEDNEISLVKAETTPSTIQNSKKKSTVVKRLQKKTTKKTMNKKTFEIEELIDHRQIEDREELLVQWKGFPEDKRTWEPLSEMPAISINKYWLKKLDNLL